MVNKSSSQVQRIDDMNAQIQYVGSWNLTATQNKEVQNSTDADNIKSSVHATSDLDAQVYLAFEGSQVAVLGSIRQGTHPVAATYFVDEKLGETKYLPILEGPSLVNQILYESPSMAFGKHNISIRVVNATKSRSYAFTGFAITKPVVEAGSEGDKILIAGSVLIALALLSSMIFVFAYVRRWHRRGRTDPERHAISKLLEKPEKPLPFLPVTSSSNHSNKTDFDFGGVRRPEVSSTYSSSSSERPSSTYTLRGSLSSIAPSPTVTFIEVTRPPNLVRGNGAK